MFGLSARVAVGQPIQSEAEVAAAFGDTDSRDDPGHARPPAGESTGDVGMMQEGLQDLRLEGRQRPSQSPQHEWSIPARQTQTRHRNTGFFQFVDQAAAVCEAEHMRRPAARIEFGHDADQCRFGAAVIEIGDAEGDGDGFAVVFARGLAHRFSVAKLRPAT